MWIQSIFMRAKTVFQCAIDSCASLFLIFALFVCKSRSNLWQPKCDFRKCHYLFSLRPGFLSNSLMFSLQSALPLAFLHILIIRLLTVLLWHVSYTMTMDLECDDVQPRFCKINIDGGSYQSVAIISDENNLANTTDDEVNTNFVVIPMDRYESIMEQLNLDDSSYDNETWQPDDSLPKDFYENADNIYKIQLEFQNLTKIKGAAFSGADNLQEIDLDYNQILYIGEDAFVNLVNLTVLSLTKNNLTIIRSNTFAGAIRLRRLHLNQNKIHHIEDGAFNLPSLENILLQNNKLKTLSNVIFRGTPRLVEAVFEENELQNINDAFLHLQHLHILILDYNQIEDIVLAKFASLPQLNQLSLRKSGWHLKENVQFDSEVNTTSKLQVLDLAENEINDGESLIMQLRVFQRIEIINLEYNELRFLGHGYQIKTWYPYLEILNMAYNPISCDWIETYVDYLNRRSLRIYPWVNSFNGCSPD